MNIINSIVKNELTPALKGITGVTVLDGWLTHYAHKFSASGSNLSFPVVAIQPSGETAQSNGDNTQFKCSRSFRVIGAVSNKNPELVTEDLNDLLYDVRKALAFDVYSNKYSMQSISFGAVSFELPEKGEPYAFFEMTIDLVYQEKYS